MGRGWCVGWGSGRMDFCGAGVGWVGCVAWVVGRGKYID
jgi:hypothetical protein